ncbi:MAG: hypothetical protein HC916_19705 [Coleofasciculaceae cyanobacterium SM2_1_6]|nr:hypothetical protein [Coleofasciculaceae cyanobacterium SM2_1_6]
MSETILILTNDEGTTEEGERGWGDTVEKLKSKTIPVATGVLERNMNLFLENIGKLFQQADAKVGANSDLKLDEVELQVKISSKGEVKLWVGAELAGEGVITLKFKRQST